MTLIDTHTHLYLEQFDTDRNQVIEYAIGQGISKFFLPNVDSSTIESMLQLSKNFPTHCFPMMGLHPCSVKENYKEELQLIEKWIEKEKFYAIGEIGIDLYWDKTFVKEQEEAFLYQTRLAKRKNLPIVIHSRESMHLILDLMEPLKEELPIGIFHCFGGSLEQAERAIALGYKLGIGGTVTYKNSTLPQVLSKINLEHIVLETDSPYLPPVPYRGKRNESAYVILVAQKLAEIYNISTEKIAEITTQNSTKIFRI